MKKPKSKGFCEDCPKRNLKYEEPRASHWDRTRYINFCALLKREGECGHQRPG